MTQPLYVWSVTLARSSKTVQECRDEIPALAKSMRKLAKAWEFQLEVADGGLVHFQGQLSLYKKRRLADVVALFKGEPWSGAHLSPMSNEGKTRMQYAGKKDTSVPDTYLSDRDHPVEELTEYQKKVMLTKLWPWQHQLLASLALPPDDRRIKVFYNKDGRVGKTQMRRYLQASGVANIVPCADPDKIPGWLCGARPKRVYIFDLERAFWGAIKKKEGNFWMALEGLKGGYLYDWRNKNQEKHIEPPHVVVFTNQMPDRRYLTGDRWDIYLIPPDPAVEEYVEYSEHRAAVIEAAWEKWIEEHPEDFGPPKRKHSKWDDVVLPPSKKQKN